MNKRHSSIFSESGKEHVRGCSEYSCTEIFKDVVLILYTHSVLHAFTVFGKIKNILRNAVSMLQFQRSLKMCALFITSEALF